MHPEDRANPYRRGAAAAGSPGDPPRDSPVGLLIVAVIESLVGVIAGWRAPAVIGSFKELFDGFGADLPGLTRFVVATSGAWWIFAVTGIVIALWIGARPPRTRAERRRQVLAVIGQALAFSVAWGVASIGLYLPIFRLGAVT